MRLRACQVAEVVKVVHLRSDDALGTGTGSLQVDAIAEHKGFKLQDHCTSAHAEVKCLEF